MNHKYVLHMMLINHKLKMNIDCFLDHRRHAPGSGHANFRRPAMEIPASQNQQI